MEILRRQAPLFLVAAFSLFGALSCKEGSIPSALQNGVQIKSVTPEIYARLNVGVGGIANTFDGRMVVAYHPFYSPKEKVGLLNDSRDGTTPYPDADWQTCTDAKGAPKKDTDHCLNWVLGLRTDANGILWILDSGQAEPRITPKLVGWDTRKQKLDQVIHIPSPASIPESQLNDMVIDLKRNVIVIADEAIATTSIGDKAALVVVDLKTQKSRRLLQGDNSVLPDETLPITIDKGMPTEQNIKLYVGVDGIALDRENEWLYFAPLNKAKLFRIRMDDLVDISLTQKQLSEKLETYSDKPNCGGLVVDSKNNVYLSELGERAIGVISSTDRSYVRYAMDKDMIWPDGVAALPDGYLYTGAAQLPLAKALNGIKDENKAPYLIYRAKPLAPSY